MLLGAVIEKHVEAGSKSANFMLQQEMESLLRDFKAVEQSYGTDVLSLTVVCAYVDRLLGNAKVERHLSRHHVDILETLRSTVAEARTTKARKG